MKLLQSKSIVRGFLDGHKGIVVDGDLVKDSNGDASTVTTETCSDTVSSGTPPASVCDGQSRDEYIDDIEEENNTAASDKTDQELINEADVHAKNDRTLAAARLLRKVRNHRILQKHHVKILEKGAEIDQMLLNHGPDPESNGWKLQFQSHTGKHDVVCYYKMDESNNMTVRIDTMIPESLAAPLAAIANQVELWHTWMPSFTFPAKMGMGEATVLEKTGRASQIAEAHLDLPWPISSRVIFAEMSLIDLVDDDDVFVATLTPVSDEKVISGNKNQGKERIEMDLGLVIKKCPTDYPGLKKTKLKCDEPMLLLSTHASISPAINIFTRTFFGPMVICLLKIAERVRSGKLHQYDDALKQERYDWLRACLRKMLTK